MSSIINAVLNANEMTELVSGMPTPQFEDESS
jgi:hypothetical protein